MTTEERFERIEIELAVIVQAQHGIVESRRIQSETLSQLALWPKTGRDMEKDLLKTKTVWFQVGTSELSPNLPWKYPLATRIVILAADQARAFFNGLNHHEISGHGRDDRRYVTTYYRGVTRGFRGDAD